MNKQQLQDELLKNNLWKIIKNPKTSLEYKSAFTLLVSIYRNEKL